MKKLVIIYIFILLILYSSAIYAAVDTEVIEEQEKNLEISDFINEASIYTKDTFQNIELDKVYKDALSGNIDNKEILKNILSLTGKEVKKTLEILGYIIIIIITHSIIKGICEGVGNKEVGEITYYIQYILIVSLIMTNFSDIIVLIKETINSLVGFLNTLLPILITLMITTGNIVSASTVQPILLLIITFIRKLNILSISTNNIGWNVSRNNIKNI